MAMSLVTFRHDEGARRISARIPLLSATSAQFHKGWGCLLEPYA